MQNSFADLLGKGISSVCKFLIRAHHSIKVLNQNMEMAFYYRQFLVQQPRCVVATR